MMVIIPTGFGNLFSQSATPIGVKIFKKKNVVGFDIVELCPNENEKSSDFLAAKLYYKLLSYKFDNNNEEDYQEPIRINEKKTIKSFNLNTEDDE